MFIWRRTRHEPVRPPLPAVLFDIDMADIERIKAFYYAWMRGMRETPEMVAVLNDYAGGRGKRHNLDLIVASWDEARRRAEEDCGKARDSALRDLGSKYSLWGLLSVLHPANDYWEGRKRINQQYVSCSTVEHIMGLADGRVLVWLAKSDRQSGQPEPWTVMRQQIELVDAAERITDYSSRHDLRA